jgi:hypothetical protein
MHLDAGELHCGSHPHLYYSDTFTPLEVPKLYLLNVRGETVAQVLSFFVKAKDYLKVENYDLDNSMVYIHQNKIYLSGESPAKRLF